MKKTAKLLIGLFLFVVLSGFQQKKIVEKTNQTHYFPIDKIASENSLISQIRRGTGFITNVLSVIPTDSVNTLLLWDGSSDINWEKFKYLVVKIWNKSDFSGLINIDFYKKGESGVEIITLENGEEIIRKKPRITTILGVLPRLKTKLIFPLEYLDAQKIFLPRYPRQLKGTLTGNRIENEDISKIEIRFGPFQKPFFTPEFEISSFYLSDKLPGPYPKPDTPLVDKFGQWAGKDWQGKTYNENSLSFLNDSLLTIAKKAKYSKEWSKYGGWKKKRFKANGFFQTHHDGKRWWLVDPKGYAFISVGIDCIGSNVTGPVHGIEDLFEWLPRKESGFKDAISGNGKMLDFYKSNLIRIYGKEWKKNWEIITTGLIKHFKINTIANWSDINYAQKSKIPYVLALRGFPNTKTSLFRDFPDVFSPEYREKSIIFAEQLQNYKDDKYLIGYFLGNEPHWAFGNNNIAFEMFGTDKESYSKNEFIIWIKEKYENNIEDFNKAWNLNISDFNEILTTTFKELPSESSSTDFYHFSELLVEKFVGIPCDEVEKIDPFHLNLGMRYAWISSDLLYKAGERFDVFSINGYSNPDPPDTEKIAEISGKPVMIGEFHFGATDRGLPATGIRGALTQKDRAEAYRNYVEQGFARPELIGIHYFQWLDQPIYGRFDGENYNIGFFDICNRPYPELTNAATLSHQLIYKIASGLIKPFRKHITKVPAIHY